MAPLMALLLCLGDEKIRVEGPPFLAFGESAEYRLVSDVDDAQPIWRMADAPGGVALAIETKPAYKDGPCTIQGAEKITVKSTGKVEGDILVVVRMERRGAKVGETQFRIRVGEPIRLRARLRPVEHVLGGTRRTEWAREEERTRLADFVNPVLRKVGVQVEFEEGRPLKAPDAWFDKEGRFHPIVMQDGKRVTSIAMQELRKHDEPGPLNVYLIRDGHWAEEVGGYRGGVIQHDLRGVGWAEGQILIDDAADPGTLAHEFGHTLGLGDLKGKSDRRRLMYGYTKHREGTEFAFEEMKIAREQAKRHRRAEAESKTKNAAAAPRRK